MEKWQGLSANHPGVFSRYLQKEKEKWARKKLSEREPTKKSNLVLCAKARVFLMAQPPKVTFPHFKQALQHCQDRNDPLAKAFIDINANPSPLFESDEDDSTIHYVGDGVDEADKVDDEVDDGNHGYKANSSQKVESMF